MPRSTFKYYFEMMVLGGMGKLSHQFSGSEGEQGFTVELDHSGHVKKWYSQLHYENFRDYFPSSDDGRKLSYIFYDPFDAPEYTYIAWQNVSKPTMERLLDITFEDKHFLPNFIEKGKTYSGMKFPESHGVMF